MVLLRTFKTFLLFWELVVSVVSSEHFENVALNKPCKMSSRLSWKGTQHPCGYAVNGDTEGVYLDTDNCIHTGRDDSEPSWEVDLGRPYPVYRISVWARGSNINRMEGCIITVDGQECYGFNQIPDTRDTNLTCTSGVLNGSVVKVSKNTTGFSGDDKTINFCEVQVFICRDGYWGSDCDKRCGNCSNSEVCDKVTGHCSRCPLGLQPPLCDAECQNGMYGQNCTQACGGGCADADCDNLSGQCTCKPGWLPPYCENVCPLGFYGSNCTQNCSVHCSDTCDSATGSCSCNPGYSPPLCAEALASDTTEGEVSPQLGIVIGAVVGSVALLVIVIIVIVVIVRRKRGQEKSPKETDRGAQNHASHQTTQHANVYQNLPDATGDTMSDLQKIDEQEAHRQESKTKRKSAVKSKPAASNEGFTYVNGSFEGHYVNSVQPPTARNESQATAMVNSFAADNTANLVEEEDVEVELQETEVDPEVERQYDVEVRERVYYNDGVYMTSAGASLKLDTVQESLLEKLRGEVIDEEFESLPVGLTKAHDTGADDENYYRNRFKSILPYEDTRVVLLGDPDPGSNDYINASYISGVHSTKAYIAAQGPNRKTVPDFWKMVWQEQVTHIVMLTNLKEGKKKKCEQYWPPPGEEMRYGSVDVMGVEEHERAHYVMRTFDIAAENGAVRRVTQYHYTMWPDHGIPTTTGLVDFWRTVTAFHRQQPQSSPLLVHCSAGVGRTGTFIGLDIVMDQLQQQQHVDIFTVVKNMRDDRCNMIQAKSQYCILHEAVLEAYTSEGTRLSHQEFDSVFRHQVDPHHANTRIDTEFKKLKQMKVLMQKPRQTEAEKAENINKNRYLDILPDDRYLVRLTTPVENRSNYINAVFMPTFLDQEGSIFTQLPLRDTIVDLWRLVAGNDVRVIVSLGSEIVQTEEQGCYWPREENQPLTCGPFIIRLTSRTPLRKHIMRYSLSLQYKGKGRPRSVEVFQHSEWQGDTASSVEDLLHLLTTLRSTPSHQQHGTPPLLLQCSDGATKSGLFHAICDVINRMTSEGIIDVFVAVRHMQIVRPQCLMSKVQYRFIYRAVQEYKKRNDIYANTSLAY